jgi:hypothetical protein
VFIRLIEKIAVEPIDPTNRNRDIESFTPEECWTNLRFRKADIFYLFQKLGIPDSFTCANRVVVSGEYAFCLFLYRMAYPQRLSQLQKVFGRDYSQLSRVYNEVSRFIHAHHQNKVTGNLWWYSDRFDDYASSIRRKISRLPPHVNPHPGYVPGEFCNIFGFVDGTSLKICRLFGNNNAQHPFWNGYLHGFFLIFMVRFLVKL